MTLYDSLFENYRQEFQWAGPFKLDGPIWATLKVNGPTKASRHNQN